MKLLLLLLCLLLCGCSQQAPETETQITAVPAFAQPQTSPVVFYDSTLPVEEKHWGGLQVFPLALSDANGLLSMGDQLLVFSGDNATQLTLVNPETSTVQASITLDFSLSTHDPSLQIGETFLSFYDPIHRQTVILDEMLEDIRRIPVTEEVTGSPILSPDCGTLFYCTSNAIRAWKLENGIHRTIKELAYDQQELIGLHMDGSVLQCRIQDGNTYRTMFLAADTGLIVKEAAGDYRLSSSGNRFYAAVPSGYHSLSIFGYEADSPMLLVPADTTAQCTFLANQHAAVTAAYSDKHSVQLDYYDLTTGLRRCILSEELDVLPTIFASLGQNTVFFLTKDLERNRDLLCRWDIREESPLHVQDSQVYTYPYSSGDSVDWNLLNQCQALALQLSEKYGIGIHIGDGALAVQPWDYTFEKETQLPLLIRELELLDQRLQNFPEAILEKTKSHFTALNICLVRNISGTAASGSLASATGIQFLNGTDSYLAITTGKYSRQALYHELFHVMETHILNESAELDQWEELNPSDFQYTYGSEYNADLRNYCTGENRAFIDKYSMTFPKEDRARIMESAMQPGMEDLFQSPILQSKLVKLCLSIRQAYGLRKSPETFLWEQYLQTPLNYRE